MHIKIISDGEEFKNIKDLWESLEDKDRNITYYNRYKYIYECWNNLYRDNELFIVCVYEGKVPLCIAPMMIVDKSKFGINFKSIEIIGCGDYRNFICNNTLKDKTINIAIKEIFKLIEEKKCERIFFTHIKSNSNLSTYLLRNSKYNDNFKYLIECPIHYFNKFNNFDEYFNFRFKPKEIKRYINKLEKDIGYIFEIKYGDEILSKLKELHSFEKDYLVKNKNKKERKSLFEEENRFNIIKNLYKNNNECITFILKNKKDEILIYDTCYLFRGILYCWNTAYDPRYEKYDLSKVLNYEIFKYIYENPQLEVNGYEYGAGRYSWKFRWADDFNLLYKLNVWNLDNRKVLKALVNIGNKFNNK